MSEESAKYGGKVPRYYVRTSGNLVGTIRRDIEHNWSIKSIEEDGRFLYCDAQDPIDLIEKYPDLANFLVINKRTINFNQKTAEISYNNGNLWSSVMDNYDKLESGNDMIINPPYYQRFKPEPIDYIIKNKLSFLEGCVLSYVLRAPYKHKTKEGQIQDYEKAISCIQKLIKQVEERPDHE